MGTQFSLAGEEGMEEEDFGFLPLSSLCQNGTWDRRFLVICPSGRVAKGLRGKSSGQLGDLFDFLHNEQPTKNCFGQGESDCLIETKHCDGRKWC
jgi:hypothetical protein